MTQTNITPQTLDERHDRFVEGYLKKEMRQQESPVESTRCTGRVPIPESEQREENSICIYVNAEELEIIREYVGKRNMSEVLRNAILDKAVYFHSLKQRRTKK